MDMEKLRDKFFELIKQGATINMTDTEAYAAATTFATIVLSEPAVRKKFYDQLVSLSKDVKKFYDQKQKIILDSLNLSEEEKEKILAQARAIASKPKKIDN